MFKLNGFLIISFVFFLILPATSFSEFGFNFGGDEKTPANYFINVKDFGAKGDGKTDDTLAIQAAIDSLCENEIGGGTVYFPPGQYLILGQPGPMDSFQGKVMKNGIMIKDVDKSIARPTGKKGNHRITLRGAGKASVLKGGSKNLIVIRVSTSFVTIKDLTINGGANYKDFGNGVVGMGFVPENMQDALTHSKVNYNVVENVHIGNTQEGILMVCGPDGTGWQSSCYWNSFSNIYLRFMTRGIYLASGVKGSPSNNRNYFENIIMNFMNVGLHIESGDTNTCIHCAINDIFLEETPYTGKVPRKVPTAIVIEEFDKWGLRYSQKNRFYNLPFEGNKRDIENANPRTEFFGINASLKKDFNLWKKPPKIYFGNGQFLNHSGLFIGKKDMLPEPSVALGIESKKKGFLPPRMTVKERNRIRSPLPGLMVYNTTSKSLSVFDGKAWTDTKDSMISFPVLTSKKINKVKAPKRGTIIINESTNKLNYFDGKKWKELSH